MQALSSCFEQNDWMCQNFLQINQDKTEIIDIWAKEGRFKVSAQLQTVMLKTWTQTWTATLGQLRSQKECISCFTLIEGVRCAFCPQS